jgi:hypothetical protein
VNIDTDDFAQSSTSKSEQKRKKEEEEAADKDAQEEEEEDQVDDDEEGDDLMYGEVDPSTIPLFSSGTVVWVFIFPLFLFSQTFTDSSGKSISNRRGERGGLINRPKYPHITDRCLAAVGTHTCAFF